MRAFRGMQYRHRVENDFCSRERHIFVQMLFDGSTPLRWSIPRYIRFEEIAARFRKRDVRRGHAMFLRDGGECSDDCRAIGYLAAHDGACRKRHFTERAKFKTMRALLETCHLDTARGDIDARGGKRKITRWRELDTQESFERS